MNALKIRIEIDPSITEEEVIIRCPKLTAEIEAVQQALTSATASNQKLMLMCNDKEYYIDMDSILFFETANRGVSAHTKQDIYQTKYTLRELDSILPSKFMRVSKSTILNTDKIFSVSKNLTSVSTVEFEDTPKSVLVSRHYYRALQDRLENR